MAKQVGPIFLERTIHNLCFYKMDGEYYVRMKPSFPNIKKSPRFRGTMQSARRMGRASRIGAALYASLPAELKQFKRYRTMTGEAFHLLKRNHTDEEALELLRVRHESLVNRAHAIASAIYEALGVSFRQPWMFWAFAQEALDTMAEGKEDTEIFALMWKCYAAEFDADYDEGKLFSHPRPVAPSSLMKGVIVPSRSVLCHLRPFSHHRKPPALASTEEIHSESWKQPELSLFRIRGPGAKQKTRYRTYQTAPR
jgi:hypothetical protein